MVFCDDRRIAIASCLAAVAIGSGSAGDIAGGAMSARRAGGVCTVPRLTRLTLSQARTQLGRNRCRVGRAIVHGGPLARLVVGGQYPLAKARVRSGTGIEIVLIEPHLARARCLPAPSERIVLSSRSARLFVRLTLVNSEFYLLFRACLPGHGAARFSEDVTETTPWSENGTRAEKFIFAGAHLAWEQRDYDRYDEGPTYISVVDMATAQLSSVFVGFAKDGEKVSEVTLSRNGRLAWVRTVEAIAAGGQSTTAYNLETLLGGEATTPRPTLLESTSDGVLSGLRFTSDGSLHWLNAGFERIASF